MKVRINKSGNLDIKRASKFKAQECIFKNSSEWCGDHCPQFGEPKVYTSKQTLDDKMVTVEHFSLELCQNKILMLDSAVVDERDD